MDLYGCVCVVVVCVCVAVVWCVCVVVYVGVLFVISPPAPTCLDHRSYICWCTIQWLMFISHFSGLVSLSGTFSLHINLRTSLPVCKNALLGCGGNSVPITGPFGENKQLPMLLFLLWGNIASFHSGSFLSPVSCRYHHAHSWLLLRLGAGLPKV